MALRIIGFTLVTIAVVGFFVTVSTLDTQMAGIIGANTRGFMFAMSQGRAYGGSLPLGPVVAAHVAVALIGIGLLIFGKRRS